MGRLTGAWRGMSRELKMAVIAAFLLFLSMFLPWYEKSYFANVKGRLAQASDGLSAFGAFSFVEAAVLLVAIAVILLCFARGEKKPFHLPGGDGVVVMAAGGWVGLLLVYRLFDKPDASAPGGAAVTVGIQWGIFFALAAAGFLFYTGYRIYSAHRPEPPLPGEVDTVRRAEPLEPARRETRATEPLIRDQRRPATPEDPGIAPTRRRIPQGPPSDEARAAADRQAQQHRPPTLPLDPPAAPAPPPEFPHSAGHAPPWQSPAEAAPPTASDPADEPPEDETVAMPGRRPPRRRADDPPDEPDTLF